MNRIKNLGINAAKSIAPLVWNQHRFGTIWWESDYVNRGRRPNTFQPVTFRADQGTVRAPLHSRYKHSCEKMKLLATSDSGRDIPPEDVVAQFEAAEAKKKTDRANASDAVLNLPKRNFFPLGDLAHVEIRGDYLTEAGLHMDALKHFGVATKGYLAAYPKYHNQTARIFIKLGRSCRLAGKHESSKKNLEESINILDGCKSPSVEHMCEALYEMGLTMMQLKDKDAGVVFEDSLRVLNAYHDLGSSHRGLRTLPYIQKRFFLHPASKLEYHSPFDYDRTYAIVDEALAEAERYYRNVEDLESVIRVLEHRTIMVDRKIFNTRAIAGRIRTHRGRNFLKRSASTSSPSATELLQFSPSLHQPYFDYSQETTAPLGMEHLVPDGGYEADGDPYRRVLDEDPNRSRAKGIAFDEAQRRWERAT